MLALMEPVLGVGPTYKRITRMHRKTAVTREASGVESPRRSTEASLRKWHWSQDLRGERQDSAGNSLCKVLVQKGARGEEGLREGPRLKHGCERQPGVI